MKEIDWYVIEFYGNNYKGPTDYYHKDGYVFAYMCHYGSPQKISTWCTTGVCRFQLTVL